MYNDPCVQGHDSRFTVYRNQIFESKLKMIIAIDFKNFGNITY